MNVHVVDQKAVQVVVGNMVGGEKQCCSSGFKTDLLKNVVLFEFFFLARPAFLRVDQTCEEALR